MNPQLTPPKPSYVERAQSMKVASGDAEIDKISELFQQFDEKAKALKESSIDSANLAREMGVHLQTLCGREQINFTFWQSRCSNLPFSFDTAKIFVATANKMQKPAESMEEATPFFQSVLIADGLLELPERTQAQTPAAIPLVQRFFNELQLMRQPFKKIVQARPMEEWEPTALELFLSETEWLAEERERAAELRKRK